MSEFGQPAYGSLSPSLGWPGILIALSGEQDQEHQLQTATARILQAAWDLQARYFSAHGDDREIRGMQEAMCRKLKELNSLFARAGAAIKDQTVRANLRKIAALAEGCR